MDSKPSITMSWIIMFNAPPGSGKDTAADYLALRCNQARHLRLKEPLFRHVCAHYGISRQQFDLLYLERTTKEAPTPLLQGLSPRETLNHVSENVCKKQYGRDCFARALADEINLDQDRLILVSDCGFREELEPMTRAVGRDRVVVVHIHRDNCTFEGDSRNWVTTGGLCREFRVDNNGTLEAFHASLDAVMTGIHSETSSLVP